jgi:hypothetical protein
MTLIEIMVTMLIFMFMSLIMFAAVRVVVSQWTLGERRRVLYEKASGVVNIIATDLRLSLCRDAIGATDLKVRFLADYEPGTTQQRLMFVRSFEYGPERAITSNAGDGLSNGLMFDVGFDPDDPDKKVVPKLVKGGSGAGGAVDKEEYDGLKVGDFKALGGMAAVGYFVKDETLYRAIHAPVPASLSSILNPAKAQIVATDVLYFSVDYWSQYTESWEEPKGKNESSGPERIWDSTRGINVFPMNRFILHRDAISLNDPEDDVVPQKVRVTVTVDSPLPRCTWTKLQEDIDENTLTLYVEDTRGFPDGDKDSFIKIEEEWMLVAKKTQDTLVIKQRGVRDTKIKSHNAGMTIRTGRTFERVIFIPNYRNDFTPDDVYYARKNVPIKKKILQ